MTFIEPIHGVKAVRRDELGNFNKEYRLKPHRGADWGFDNGSQGKPVRAVADMIVARVLETSELGDCAILKHQETKTYWMYSHLQNIKVQRMDRVAQGEEFAEIGPHKNGPHLHLAVSYEQLPHLAAFGKLLDPFKLIDASKPKTAPVAKTPPTKPAAKKAPAKKA